MAIIASDLITKTDLIARFNTRVRDWVTANTNWVSSTGVWNTNVGTVLGNSTAYGGGVNKVAQATAQPPEILPADINVLIGASSATSGYVVNILKGFMKEYSKNYKVNLLNTGNLAPGSYTGTVRVTNATNGLSLAVESDVEAAATANGIVPTALITATNLNNFIESCRNIWTNRCLNSVYENFYYSYCHSSCHTNHTCYNSRGRR